ncbi:MAG TPA: CRISPR-associated protein Cas4 [Sedimentisphaerales bacterium]|nr:CRISPR-associated protein Cas4 [Sedimentisphaerales bacterium]
MYTEDDLLPISALQHLLYCERQCALIHIERAWEENLFTAEGRILHEKVDSGEDCVRAGKRIARSLPLRSLQLGLSGIADVVEFGPERGDVYPIEYKRGRSKAANWDRVQLCAQAMALEEMLGVTITEGALFYGKTRRREVVMFDAALRGETIRASERLHQLIASGQTPAAQYDAKCDACSLIGLCMPELPKNKSVSRYLAAMADAE